jgi:hypothetical protein
MQINHFLPYLLCSVNLIFNRLFCNSSLPQHVSSASHSSVILFFFFLLYHSALLLLYFYITFCISSIISHHASPSYCFILFPFRTTNPIQSRSFSFIHNSLTIPLPLPIGNTQTSVLTTETLTDL